MKKLLCLLFFAPVIVHAKGWEIGLGAGISANSKLDEFIESNNTKMKFSGALDLSVARRLNPKLELGLDITAVDLVRIANNITYYYYGIPGGTYNDARMHIGKMGLLITPFLSWHLNHFYLGARAGYFTSIAGDNDYSGSHAELYYNDFKGFCLGLHGGYNWTVLSNLLIFMELRGNYIEAKQGGYGFNTYQGTLLAGAKYVFSRPGKNVGNK